MKLIEDLSIKSRLILMMLAISVLSILLVGLVGYSGSRAALTYSIFNQLTGLRAAKTYEIESYFERIESQLRTLSESLTVINAINELTLAFDDIPPQALTSEQEQELLALYDDEFLPELGARVEGEPVADGYYPDTKTARYLQYHYLAASSHPRGKKHLLDQADDGTSYSQAHGRFHPILRHFLEEFGYYDLFLVDVEGRIVYSVYKETDFATNLITGPYSSSNLAAVVKKLRKAQDRGVVELIDFAPYRPSLMAPAAFIATPIFDGSRRRGTLVFQLPIDEINQIMTGDGEWRRNGLGDTGETYLAGSDRHMRSISRFLTEDLDGYLESLRAAVLKDGEGEELEVVRLERGELFGEMTLFTGALSPMSIVATVDLMVMVIEPDSAHALLSSTPQFSSHLGHTIEMRKKALRILRIAKQTQSACAESYEGLKSLA